MTGDTELVTEATEKVVEAARALLVRKIEFGVEAGVEPEVIDAARIRLAKGDLAADAGDQRGAIMSYQEGWTIVHDAQG